MRPATPCSSCGGATRVIVGDGPVRRHTATGLASCAPAGTR